MDKSLEPFAEAVWREWWRRSGIPRQDFKDVATTGPGTGPWENPWKKRSFPHRRIDKMIDLLVFHIYVGLPEII